MRRVLLVICSAVLVLCPAIANATPDDESLDRLIALVVERLDTGDVVAAAKWAAATARDTEPTVDDPSREAEVYDAMARLGRERGLPVDWVREVFAGQIEANKTVQRGLMTRWRFDPAAVPHAPADLVSVRPRIDRMNEEIVEQLAAQRNTLTGPRCMERLAHSVFGVFTAARSDALHHTALVRAAVPLCSA
ncbi:gamma subclass chorismate mutase AroQ [Nocardia sp. NPDC049220]|uniref:gamma subclass chorismate mutase AroQ n=1 Tax=Nocardia sp. NPDC049220 TaxID=3155273 RepID=UPI0033BFE3C0